MSVELPPVVALLAGALALPLLPRRWRGGASLLFPAAALALVVTLPEGRLLAFEYLGFELVLLEIDPLRRVFGLIFALIALAGGIYGLHLRETGQRVAGLLYAGSALGVIFAGDFLTLFVFWELMAVSATYLIWARRRPESDRAGLRYLLVHLAGGATLLAGIVLHAVTTGSLELTRFAPGESLASWLILAGVAVNAAIVPLHAWLPDAYPRATVTGAVLLSAFTTKTAVFVLAALFPGWPILLTLGVVMTLYGVTYAVLANDIREILSYHIVSQVGYMVAGVGIGTELALNGSTAHAYSHILYKGLLFMGAGAVLHATGKSKLSELGGLARTMPWTLVLYMVGALSISGAPLFNGFISKAITLEAAGEAGFYAAKLLLILASVGTFLSVGLKLPYYTWFGRDRGLRPEPLPRNMVIGMALVAGLCLLYGVAPDLLYAWLPFAMDYTPFTLPHFVEVGQVLLFTFVAFWVTRRLLEPAAKIHLDTDWLYRRPAPLARRVVVDGVDTVFARCEDAVQAGARALARLAAHPVETLRSLRPPERAFDPDRDRHPMGDALTWTLVTIVAVALLALLR